MQPLQLINDLYIILHCLKAHVKIIVTGVLEVDAVVFHIVSLQQNIVLD